MKHILLTLNLLFWAGLVLGQGQSFNPMTEPGVNNLVSTIESFTAREAGGSVYLNWTVSSNDDNHYYLIEKAHASDQEFTVLDIKKGNKSPEGVRLLNGFTDEEPAVGEYIYRIRLLGGDMSEVISPVRRVQIGSDVTVRLIK